MYQANLSFRNLQKYLAELSETSLICFQAESQCYTITARGQQFLDAYKEYSKSNRHIEKVLTDVKSKKANLERLFNQ
jgi:predicted transcriptional regulator